MAKAAAPKSKEQKAKAATSGGKGKKKVRAARARRPRAVCRSISWSTRPPIAAPDALACPACTAIDRPSRASSLSRSGRRAR